MDLRECLKPDLFAGKVAFLTGGGSGINLGIAKMFASLGANVAICGRTESRLEGAAAELRALGARVVTAVADVRDYDAVAAALAASAAALGPADVVVAGAAGNFLARAETLSAKGFKTVIDIDLMGSFHTAHAAFAQLQATRGTLLFISAGQAYLPFLAQAHVGAAKAGIDNLMRNLALEWGRHGIRSNSIVPGPIAGTEGMARLGGSHAEAWKAAVPLGRFGEVWDIGAMAAVLASPLGSYVTGAQVIVDGGWGLGGSAMFNAAFAAAPPPPRK